MIHDTRLIRSSREGGLGLVPRIALGVLALLFIVLVARVMATGSSTALMLVVAVAGGTLVAFRPLIGLYACYGLLILVPYTEARIDLPIFRSPLQAVALITGGVAAYRFLSQDRRLPRSDVYLPLTMVLVLYAAFFLVHHGEAAQARAYSFVVGMWPMVLILLLVRTPRQARNVLVAMCGTCVVLTLLWLPGLLSLSETRSGALGDTVRGISERGPGELGDSGAVSLLGAVGSLSYPTLVALALVSTVLLGIGLSSRRLRWVALSGYAFLAVTVASATIASAVATLIVGTVLVFLLFLMPLTHDRRGKVAGMLVAIPVILVLSSIALSLPPGQRAIERLADPANDVSGSVRLDSLDQGWHAFLEDPVIGYGAYDRYVTTPQGWRLSGHNTFGVIAYEFGLIMLVPFLWMLAAIARGMWQLLRHSVTPTDTGLATGFLAAFLAAVFTGFLTPTFGVVFQDAVIWTLVGLTIVWNSWRQEDPHARLVTSS